ncbi:c-type cytochrome [Steroidobacter sp. S1-65]|uniref:C-type cytochrome n=1 Tax=Steroidobacter gossypii TaxID=2805490 RepID=A0ABS1X0T4_9GAMM|nr:c-type cytochrome [Steroidobacter gossypii]MBM0106782.1 c-type cytochrome [Steroidobacter gossypii]
MITRDVVAAGWVVLGIAWAAPPASAAEPAPAAFNNHCRTCHSVKEGDHRLGPSLHKIHGAKAGASSGYGNYSQGLKSSGITWDDATLDKFIQNPDQVVPNNNMKPYKGIDDQAVRQQIVDYLRSQSSS